MSNATDIVKELWPDKVPRVAPLPGGHTNANFLISLDDERFVLRIPGDNTHVLGIDRGDEYEANQLASSIGVGPEVLKRSAAEGWMVTRFVAGGPLSASELASEPTLELVVATLLRVHRGGSVTAVLDPFSVIAQYHDALAQRGRTEPFDYQLARARLGRVSEARTFRATSFCHNDLRNDNFLFDGGELRILDWEYAGMGDPLFDLANFSTHQQFSNDADERLLTHYFGHCDEPLFAALGLMKVVSELREAMWNLVQEAVSSLDLPFGEFAQQRIDRYESLVAALDFDGALEHARRAT